MTEEMFKPKSIRHWIAVNFGGRFEQGEMLFVYPSPIRYWRSHIKWKAKNIYYKSILLFNKRRAWRTIKAFFILKYYQIFNKSRLIKITTRSKYFLPGDVVRMNVKEGSTKLITLGYDYYLLKPED